MLVFVMIAMAFSFTTEEKEEVCLLVSTEAVKLKEDDISYHTEKYPLLSQAQLKTKISDDVFNRCMQKITNEQISTFLSDIKYKETLAKEFDMPFSKFTTEDDIKVDKNYFRKRMEISKRLRPMMGKRFKNEL